VAELCLRQRRPLWLRYPPVSVFRPIIDAICAGLLPDIASMASWTLMIITAQSSRKRPPA
jgi:hypothetical protein